MPDQSNNNDSDETLGVADDVTIHEAAAPADEALDTEETNQVAHDADQEKAASAEGASLAALLRMAVGGARQSGKAALQATELGVYRGRSLSILLEQAAQLSRDIEWTGIDTFRGLPELGDADRKMAPENANYLIRPMFDDTTLREVEAFLSPISKSDRLTLIEGQLDEVLKDLPGQRYSFVNMSIKLYHPTLLGLKYFYKRMLPGGVIVFDDYFNRRFPMAAAAVDEFLEGKPENISLLTMMEPSGPTKRAFIVREG